MKKIFYSITKNISALLIGQIIYKIFAFIMMIIMARFLGVEDFGRFSYAMSFVWIFLFLSDMGLSELFIRDVASNPKLQDSYINNIIPMKILIGAVAYIFIIILAFIFSGDNVKFWLIIILGGSVIMDSMMYFFRSLFRAKETMEKESVLMIIEAFLKLAIIALLINSGMGISRVKLIALGILFISAVNLLINLYAFKKNHGNIKLSVDVKFWLYLLRNGLPFAGIYILSLINFRIDVIMLSAMKSDYLVGLYNADFKIMEQIFMIPVMLSFVLLPVFSRMSSSIDRLKNIFIKTAIFLSIASILCVFFCYVFGKWIILTIYGIKFEEAIAYFYVFSWVIVPFFLKPIFEKLFYGIKRQAIVCFVYTVGIIFHIVFNVIMIPEFGVKGALLGTLLSEIIMVAALMLFLFRVELKGLILDTAVPEMEKAVISA